MADEDMDFEGFNFFEPKSVLEAAARGDLDTVQSGLLQFGEFVLLEGDGGAGLTVRHISIAQNRAKASKTQNKNSQILRSIFCRFCISQRRMVMKI